MRTITNWHRINLASAYKHIDIVYFKSGSNEQKLDMIA